MIQNNIREPLTTEYIYIKSRVVGVGSHVLLCAEETQYHKVMAEMLRSANVRPAWFKWKRN